MISSQAIELLAQLLPLTLAGLIIGQLASRSRWFHYMGYLTNSLNRASHLPPRVAPALTIFLFNPEAALATLATQQLTEREAQAAYLTSALPMGIHYALIYFGPIAIPTLGMVGVVYLVLYLLIFAGVTVAGIILGKTWLSPTEESIPISPEADEGIKKALWAALQQFVRVAIILVPSVLIMYAVIETEAIAAQIKFLPSLVGLPPESLIVLLTGVASTVAALGVAAPLFQQGILGPTQVLASLLLAYSLHIFAGFLHYDLPLAGSLFGPRLGTRMAALFQVVHQALILTIAAAFLVISY